MGYRLVKLKSLEIPALRMRLLQEQLHRCPLCLGKIQKGSKNPALDHDHDTGYIRDVLCINCNGMEGKVWNLARRAHKGNEIQWLENILSYYLRHQEPKHGGLVHPTHKDQDQKRIARNKRARKKRSHIKTTEKTNGKSKQTIA